MKLQGFIHFIFSKHSFEIIIFQVVGRHIIMLKLIIFQLYTNNNSYSENFIFIEISRLLFLQKDLTSENDETQMHSNW